MLSHVGIEVGDLERSRGFYEAALAPLGIAVVMEFDGAVGFGKETERGPNPFFWLNARGRPASSGVHVCFGARATDMVAFVLDPDGNNIEAVCHTAP